MSLHGRRRRERLPPRDQKRLENLGGCELAQNEGKNAAVVEIFEFVERRYAAEERYILYSSIGISDPGLHRLARPERAAKSMYR